MASWVRTTVAPPAEPPPPKAPAIEDAPVYAVGGLQEADGRPIRSAWCAACASRTICSSASRAASVTVKFAVGHDGTPSRFQAMTTGLPDRVSSGIWAAIQACKWNPGADAQGRPTTIWVILPIRFAQE